MTRNSYRKLIIQKASKAGLITLPQALKENERSFVFERNENKFSVSFFGTELGSIIIPRDFLIFLNNLQTQSSQEVYTPDEAYKYFIDNTLTARGNQLKPVEIFMKNINNAMFGKEHEIEWVHNIASDVSVETDIDSNNNTPIGNQYKNYLGSRTKKKKQEQGWGQKLKGLVGLTSYDRKNYKKASYKSNIITKATNKRLREKK